MSTSRQLQDMMRDYLKQGVNCIYLSASVRECHYALDLMVDNYRYKQVSQVMKRISFNSAYVRFHSTSQPPHTLKGRTELIIADHAAFRDKSNEAHFREYHFMIHFNRMRLFPDGKNHK